MQPAVNETSVVLDTISLAATGTADDGVIIEMSASNYTLVPLYSNGSNNGDTNGQPVDTLLVSTVDQAVYTTSGSYEPFEAAPYYYEHSQAFPGVADDFVNSGSHHFYCYSSTAGPDDSFVEEVLGERRQSKPVIARSERRVEFAGLTRRRSRIAALRRRSRSRSRTEEDDLENESEEKPEEEAEDEEEGNETGFDEFDSAHNGNRRESDLMRFLRSARSRSPSASAFRQCKRSQMHRLSLLGRPIHVRQPKHVNLRYRQYQNQINKFLERPRGWKAMAYHVIM